VIASVVPYACKFYCTTKARHVETIIEFECTDLSPVATHCARGAFVCGEIPVVSLTAPRLDGIRRLETTRREESVLTKMVPVTAVCAAQIHERPDQN